MAGVSVGGLIVPLVAVQFIFAFGWRVSYLLLGIIILVIAGEYLYFWGRDIKEDKDFEEVIPLDSIIEVFFDFDKHLKSNMDSSFGIGGPVPLVVHYQANSGEQTKVRIVSLGSQKLILCDSQNKKGLDV